MTKKLVLCLISIVFISCSFVGIAFGGELLNGLTTEPLNLKNFGDYKRELAISFAEKMQDKSFQKILKIQINDKNASSSMLSIVEKHSSLSKQEIDSEFKENIFLLDQRIREAKGTQNHTKELLNVRLASPESNLKKFQAGEETLVAYVPDGDEKDWEYVEAFDSNGNIYYLDPFKEPTQPVIIVGIDGREDLRAGLQMVNEALQKAGLQAENTNSEKGYTETTKLDYISLKNDQEPWISGNSEIFAFVSGVQASQMEAQISVVDMPYLDKSETNYYPNQIIIFWDQYRYAAANINFFEKDDNYNYQELIGVLLKATASIMAMFPETAPYSGLVSLANEIIQAMPDEWFTNNDDYVDIFYTIEKGRTYSGKYGVSGNAKIDLTPYNLQEN